MISVITRTNVILWVMALAMLALTNTNRTSIPGGERFIGIEKRKPKTRVKDAVTLSSIYKEFSLDPSAPIRQWGCVARNETPLIFIHIGKSGGGSVRARFAASALNYTRGQNWKDSKDRHAYYPIPIDFTSDYSYKKNATTVEKRGYFCNSNLKRFRLIENTKSFEGYNLPCSAVTPLGQAVSCPGPSNLFKKCEACQMTDLTCYRVYAGHNGYGNEIHWLPPAYLYKWMNSTMSLSAELEQFVQSIRPESKEWCNRYNHSRPKSEDEYHEVYKNCSIPLAKRVDGAAHEWIRLQEKLGQEYTRKASLKDDETDLWDHPSLPEMDHSHNWGPLYASLPVLRTTVLREPFSWLVSKFFWHKRNETHTCDNVSAAVFHEDTTHIALMVSLGRDVSPGWAHRMALNLILHLCGEDCQARWEHASTVLGPKKFTSQHESVLVRSFVRQVDYNIRHGMAVVGLNDDIQGFYDMVTTRVSYVNMSLNPRVHGAPHSSSSTPECKALYQHSEFQQSLLRSSSTIRAVVGLYDTAKRVNAFQKNEMRTCRGEEAGIA